MRELLHSVFSRAIINVGFTTFLNYEFEDKFQNEILMQRQRCTIKKDLFSTHPIQLLAWPADVPEAVTVVTIAPDFHGIHHGYITHLRKFTAYFTSALCFTTPGDGPPSTPQLVRTHEDSKCASAVGLGLGHCHGQQG